jgi:hypothetical protein
MNHTLYTKLGVFNEIKLVKHHINRNSGCCLAGR